MHERTIACPQCGATLAVNEGDTFVICNVCGTRTVLEQAPDEAASFAPTRFVDPQSGICAFTARIPQGWRPQGAIQPNNVMDNWVTVTGSATAGNGLEKILFESMCVYRHIKDDPARRGWDEPMYSAQDLRLFWRYHKADEYADEIAAQLSSRPTLAARTELPGTKGAEWSSEATYRSVWQMEQQSMAQGNAMAGGGMVWDLRGLELTSALSLYRVPSKTGDKALIIATTCKATDVTLQETWGAALRGNMGMGGGFGGFAAPGFGGALGGMFGGAFGGQGVPQGAPAQQGVGLGTTNYIEWRPTYYLMLTEWPVAPGSLDKFAAFVDSLELDPSVQQAVQFYSSQYDAQLAHMMWENNMRWERVSSFARQQSAELDSWRADNWNRMQEHDRQMAEIANMGNTPSSYGGGESINDRIQRLRHEATYGVNTYEREDGTEYEFSTQAERAFECDYDPRIHVGTEGYYDDYVPDGWTEGWRKL